VAPAAFTPVPTADETGYLLPQINCLYDRPPPAFV